MPYLMQMELWFHIYHIDLGLLVPRCKGESFSTGSEWSRSSKSPLVFRNIIFFYVILWKEGKEAERCWCSLFAFTVQNETVVKKYLCLLKASEVERCIKACASSPFMLAAAACWTTAFCLCYHSCKATNRCAVGQSTWDSDHWSLIVCGRHRLPLWAYFTLLAWFANLSNKGVRLSINN